MFAYIRLTNEPDAAQDEAISKLERAGHPVVRIAVADRYHIGQEFFRWEFATAVAGSILGINPFDQPDVEASKVKTRELTSAYENSGKLPAETPILRDQGVQLFTDKTNAEVLAASARLACNLSQEASRPSGRRRLFRAACLRRAQRLAY